MDALPRGDKTMIHLPSSGLRLCNALPREDQYYGRPSLTKTKIMECPHGGPQDDVITFKPSAMVDLTLYKLQPIIMAGQMKLISA